LCARLVHAHLVEAPPSTMGCSASKVDEIYASLTPSLLRCAEVDLSKNVGLAAFGTDMEKLEAACGGGKEWIKELGGIPGLVDLVRGGDQGSDVSLALCDLLSDGAGPALALVTLAKGGTGGVPMMEKAAAAGALCALAKQNEGNQAEIVAAGPLRDTANTPSFDIGPLSR